MRSKPFLISVLSCALFIGGTANGKTAGPKVKSVSYECMNGMKILAKYDNIIKNNPKVILNISGKSFTLNNAISASGARYTNANGIRAGKAIQWWTKGVEATLYEGPRNEGRLLKESKIITKCRSKS